MLLKKQRFDLVHRADTRQRHVFCDQELLALLEKKEKLVNRCSSSLVDQSALIEALDQNRLAGAGIDVFDIEPPLPARHPILKSPNTVLVPRIGFETFESNVR